LIILTTQLLKFGSFRGHLALKVKNALTKHPELGVRQLTLPIHREDNIRKIDNGLFSLFFQRINLTLLGIHAPELVGLPAHTADTMLQFLFR
jgi:hypothetical protein